MSKHKPAAQTRVSPGYDAPALRNAVAAPAVTQEAEEKEQFAQSTQDFEAALDRARAADKFGEVMAFASYVTDQSPTQVWGRRVLNGESVPPYVFSRWYFRGNDNAVIDLFLTQEKYDAADVEGRRAMSHKYGTRYAALGPMHSRQPHADKKLRAQFPSLVEQLAQKVG